ncbi:phage baseplate assembly protein V, partial [Capnocytophaga gingivalis]|uniref:phage baseplate assembly protein V n=1 Tax=Capnocytophaga gingivalis TaxID=1017 RepID=UPI0028D23F61
SRNPHVHIGCFVKLIDINGLPMETYRVIDIKHYQSGDEYYNEFVAIPDVFVAYYYDEQALPKAEQQPARVIDNNDPEGWGRVRVQFIWQEKHQTKTLWIRVVQPHAGADKGFYFIPEIGEEVWVDFEDQNAERPFVVGSNYNGKEYSPFYNQNNDIKAIQTRSGHRLIFTEDESILLSDKNGNTLRFDTQGKNIEISAPENIIIKAGGDIKMQAGNNVATTAKNNISLSAQEGSLSNLAKGDIVNHSENISNTAENYIEIKAKTLLINASKETEIKSEKKLLMKSEYTEISGAINKLELP